jgi:hypothetical protein
MGLRMQSVQSRAGGRVARDDLGFACVVLGCLWAVAAALVATQTGIGRGRSPAAFGVMACLLGTIGCAMLTLALFPRMVRWLRVAGWLSVAGGCVLALATAWSAWDLPPEQLQWFDGPVQAHDASDLAVTWSLIMLTCSVGLIATRLLSNLASRHAFRPRGAVQAVFLLFWRQHRLVGWMALALSAAHSVYFLCFPRDLHEQWTGIVAFALLGLLGLVGLVTSYRKRTALWVHRGIAIALAVVLTMHWPPLLYVETGALLVLAITAVVNLKLAAALVAWVAGADTH